MSVLDKLAHSLGRRDEVPNQELARDLAAKKDKNGIREVAENLWNKDRNIQADCIKVLYEIGYINPRLIWHYGKDFVKLLKSKNNRLVWGAMTAIAEIARLYPKDIIFFTEDIKAAMDKGSVITRDNGVLALSRASVEPDYAIGFFPYLLKCLATCRPKDVPQYAEKIVQAVNASNKTDFIKVLEKRMEDLSGGGLTRVKKVIKQVSNL